MVNRILFCLAILKFLTVFSLVYADESYPVFPYHKFTYKGEDIEISTEIKQRWFI